MGGLIYFVLIIPAGFLSFSSGALRRRDRAQRLQDPDRDHPDSRLLLLNCPRSLLIGPAISNNFEADRANLIIAAGSCDPVTPQIRLAKPALGPHPTDLSSECSK